MGLGRTLSVASLGKTYAAPPPQDECSCTISYTCLRNCTRKRSSNKSKPHPRSPAWCQLLFSFFLDNEINLRSLLAFPQVAFHAHPVLFPLGQNNTPCPAFCLACRGEEQHGSYRGGRVNVPSALREHRRKVVTGFIEKCAEPLSGSSRYILSYTALLAVLGLAKDNECNLLGKVMPTIPCHSGSPHVLQCFFENSSPSVLLH